MLDVIDIGVEQAIAYRVAGKITEEDMTTALTGIKDQIYNFGNVFIYQEIESIGGVELDAIVEKIKFMADVGLSNFSRMAVVTDKQWMHKIIDLEDQLFKNIEIKCFSTEQKEEAIDFLRVP
ncbi:STAS/SEC14 domain-containing protein [Desulfogranum marinum]|uniref:STAS/SEC14 domain-containing protein n=1 Tax=Desulfogranum marinum TaxID=453220 RepID=UPI00196235D6|nr:STAS/SEC14 domain-containing protein [Desulfogranum marinum]MBM9514607.1 STAS/SEC14 domain-containing protein [Desulfogranum marinum]